MVMKSTNNKKTVFDPKSRHSRLASATIILLGLFTFLLLTWNDYSEADNVGFLDNNDNNENNIPTNSHNDMSTLTSRIGKETNTVINNENNPNFVTDKILLNDVSFDAHEESKLNSKKVEEQISTIRSEISNERKTTVVAPTSTGITTKGFNPDYNFNEILNTSPVVLFIRSSNTDSQYLKNLLLKEYEISPEISIVDLDQHSHGDKLQEYILNQKLSIPSSNSVPYLFINSASVINTSIEKDIKKLHSDGSLLQKFRHLANGKVLFEKMGLPSNS